MAVSAPPIPRAPPRLTELTHGFSVRCSGVPRSRFRGSGGLKIAEVGFQAFFQNGEPERSHSAVAEVFDISIVGDDRADHAGAIIGPGRSQLMFASSWFPVPGSIDSRSRLSFQHEDAGRKQPNGANLRTLEPKNQEPRTEN